MSNDKSRFTLNEYQSSQTWIFCCQYRFSHTTWWTKFVGKHRTSFAIIATGQVCVPGNLLFNQTHTCPFPYWFLQGILFESLGAWVDNTSTWKLHDESLMLTTISPQTTYSDKSGVNQKIWNENTDHARREMPFRKLSFDRERRSIASSELKFQS